MLQFRRLAVIRTGPTHWGRDPKANGQALISLLGTLIDPSRPGLAALCPVGPAESGEWLTGDAAVGWLAQQRALWCLERDDPEHFDAITDHRARIFVDWTRIASCLSDLPPAHEESNPLGTDDRGVYATLDVDWSFSDSMFWTPQLSLWNYWPGSLDVAPPAPKAATVPTVSPAEAAIQLEDVLWRDVDTAFMRLRDRHGLATIYIPAGDGKLGYPVFYVAEPSSPIASPEQLQAQYGDELAALTRRTLGADPWGGGVSWGTLDGHLIAIQREVRDNDVSRSYVQLLPYGQKLEWKTLESSIGRMADRLSFASAAGVFAFMFLDREFAKRRATTALWRGLMEEARDTADSLHERALLEVHSRGSLRDMRRLQLALTRGELDLDALQAETDDLLRMLADVSRDVDSLAGRAAMLGHVAGLQPFEFNSLSPRHLLEPRLKEVAQSASRLASAYRQMAAGTERALTLADDDRRDSEERSQRRLTIAVAFLAAVAALPLLTGNVGWEELPATVLAAGWPWSDLVAPLEYLHPSLAALTVVFAAVGIIALLLLAVLPALDLLWDRSSGKRVESDLLALRRMETEAARLADAPGAPGRARDRLAALDLRAARHLARVLDHLAASAEPDTEAGTNGRARRSVLLLECIGQRPRPSSLPLCTCLYRWRGSAIAAAPVVTPEEFEEQFTVLGYKAEAIRDIEETIDGYSGRTAAEMLDRLIGLEAMRRPAGQLAV